MNNEIDEKKREKNTHTKLAAMSLISNGDVALFYAMFGSTNDSKFPLIVFGA